MGDRHRTATPNALAALYSLVWTEPAVANLQAVGDDILQFNPQAARRVAAELIETAESLRTLPFRGRGVAGTAFRDLLAHHPYIIRYRIDGREVVILRLRYATLRPIGP